MGEYPIRWMHHAFHGHSTILEAHQRVRKINSYFQCKGVFDVDAHTKELMSRPDDPADLLKEQPKDADVDPTDVGACRIKSKKEPITADSPIVFKKKAKAACALFCNQSATQNPNACRFCLMDVCYHQDLSLAGNAAAYLFADASTEVMSKALATFSLAVESEDRVLMKPDPESTKEDSETGEEDAT